MAVYQSEFTGATIDARLAAVATMQTAISNLETAVAAKYSKPAAGIPSTDMDADVQAALAKALTAVQSLADYYTKTQVDALCAAIAASVNATSGVTAASLPTASADTVGKMYYIGPTNGEYARYVTAYDGTTYSWISIGTTDINLSQYATLSDLDSYVIESVPGSKNIIDTKENVSWKTSLSTTGAEQSSTNYNSTTFMPVEPSTGYISSAKGYVVYYNTNKVKVGSRKELTETGGTFTTPADAAYIRFAALRTAWQSAHINKGVTLEDLDAYKAPSEYNKIDKNTEGVSDLESTLYRTGYVPITGFTSGSYITTAGYPGDVVDVSSPTESAGYSHIVLSVVKGDQFRITGTGGSNGRLFVFTDSSYTIVQFRSSDATDTNLILTAPTAGYLIVNFITQYPYSLERVVTELAVDLAVDSDFDRGPFNAYGHRFATRYRGLQESYPIGSALGQNTTYAEAIALMDGLVTAGAGYVTKTALGTGEGTDGGGNPYTIYDYAFIPPAAPNTNVVGKRPVVMIDACLHGFEKNAFYGWYFFFKDVIENWEENPSLAAIRSGVEIHFIPVANPWGFDNDIRNNYNGVNLNRNFLVPNWEPVASGSDASGAAPFDQAEAAVIRDWLNAYQDAFLLIDTHTNGHYNANGWVEANHDILVTDTNDAYYNRMFNAAQRHIEDNTVAFAKDYSLAITPRFGQFHSNLSTTTNGYICVYGATERKMLSTTLEGFNGLVVNDEQVVGFYSADAKKMNSEIFGNYLLDMLEEFMK